MIVLFLFVSLIPDATDAHPHFLYDHSGVRVLEDRSELQTNVENLEDLFSNLKLFHEATNGDNWSYARCPVNSKWDITQVPSACQKTPYFGKIGINDGIPKSNFSLMHPYPQ